MTISPVDAATYVALVNHYQFGKRFKAFETNGEKFTGIQLEIGGTVYYCCDKATRKFEVREECTCICGNKHER